MKTISPGLRFRDLRLRFKFLIAFIALSVVPLILIAFLALSASNRTIENLIGVYSRQLVEQIAVNVSSGIGKIRNLTDEILISPEVTNRLLVYPQSTEQERTSVRLLFGRNLLLKFMNVAFVDDVFMTFQKGDGLESWDHIHTSVQVPWTLSQIQGIMAKDRDVSNTRNLQLTVTDLGPGRETEIIVSRQFGNPLNSDTAGHLLVAINQSYVRSLYQEIDLGTDSNLFLVDEKGVVVSSLPNGPPIGSRGLSSSLSARLASTRTEGARVETVSQGADARLVGIAPLGAYSWYVVGSIPFSYLNAETAKTSIQILAALIVLLVLAIVAAFAIARGLTAPLSALEARMETFGEGKTDVRVEVDRKDEVGRLQSSFNTMAEDLKKLVARIEEEHRLRQLSELKLIEYQINPHFLYNSLDSINWMAEKAGHSEIGEMATALARFFRLGLSRGSDFYRVSDEIEHLQNYLTVCRVRFRDQIEFHFAVAAETLNLRIMKILLQPLVENAIKHGLSTKSDGARVVIRSCLDDTALYLSVEDNGRGMDPVVLERARASLSSHVVNDADGYGLTNIQQRIRLQHGEHYGLEIHSAVGSGTRVRIRLPLNTSNVF